ncbi:flavin prenyltransferase UbiX [Prochlorococcus sp. MIT 1307]|uniref:flavin prenyltransferase UbiX n=1 Tax=Prochlorococcus sp. MIT 1307 TaxID=3096219 RepID=UPI002A74916C|nr:flavin prenyltransferase UbiX [Prochlorococcus sp. MIT 1307]
MKPLVVAVTGASAMPLAERALQLLLKKGFSINLILSKGAYEVFLSENNLKVPLEPITQRNFWEERLKINAKNLNCYRWSDHSANIASGSFKTLGMIVIPCSMGTLGRIAAGFSNNLIERTADVHLKERRPLILVPRESPLSLIHLKNMTNVSEAGAIICPPVPAWYTSPKNLEEMIDFIVIRIFDLLGEDLAPLKRWSAPNK